MFAQGVRGPALRNHDGEGSILAERCQYGVPGGLPHHTWHFLYQGVLLIAPRSQQQGQAWNSFGWLPQGTFSSLLASPRTLPLWSIVLPERLTAAHIPKVFTTLY